MSLDLKAVKMFETDYSPLVWSSFIQQPMRCDADRSIHEAKKVKLSILLKTPRLKLSANDLQNYGVLRVYLLGK